MEIKVLNLRSRMMCFMCQRNLLNNFVKDIFKQEDIRGMTNIEITWYSGRSIDDIHNVEEKLRNEEDANILRDFLRDL
jgi:hypothetical protein